MDSNLITLTRTSSTHPDFITLVKLLDADLALRDGVDHGYYAQFNKIDTIKQVIVAYVKGIPAGCGAIKEFDCQSMEVKRIFTFPEFRGKGIASYILAELEKWAVEMGYSHCILETGKRQPEAIALYEKCRYHRTDNYGQYQGMKNSVCFKKQLLFM